MGFHQAIKVLLMDDRKVLWGMLQQKVCSVLAGIADRVAELSIPELFEILALCSKYIQLGEEFSGSAASEYPAVFIHRYS